MMVISTKDFHFSSLHTRIGNLVISNQPGNEQFDQLYKDDRRLSTMIWVFSLIAIFISSPGLFGLTAFADEQRKKEIGIRKCSAPPSAAWSHCFQAIKAARANPVKNLRTE
jgi:hypothetical protein